MPVESAPDAKAVTEAEDVEQATREGLSSSNIVSTRDKQPSTTRRKQNALGRPLLLFPVKDAVKSNDLEDNKTIDQLPQGPVINSSFMRMDTRFRRPCRA